MWSVNGSVQLQCTRRRGNWMWTPIGGHFLTLIKWFAIWWPIWHQDSVTVAHQLEAVFFFCEQSLPNKFLTDNNNTTFTCRSFKKLPEAATPLMCQCPVWKQNCEKVSQNYKDHCSQEAVYWHNATPKRWCFVFLSIGWDDKHILYQSQGDWCCPPTSMAAWTIEIRQNLMMTNHLQINQFC